MGSLGGVGLPVAIGAVCTDRHLLTYNDCNPHWGKKPVVAPALEPITVAELKEHVRLIDDGSQDNLIARYLRAARQKFERETQRALLKQTWNLYLDRFPVWEIPIRKCPLISIGGIAYVDPDGNPQTLDPSKYDVAANSEPARLTPKTGQVWPATRIQPEAVTITCVVGYGTEASDVPEEACQAIRMLAGFWTNTGKEAVGRVGDPIAFAWDACVDELSWTKYG